MNEPRPVDKLTFDDVAELFLVEVRKGRRPALNEFADRYPHLADDIRELFPMLFELEAHQDANSGAAQQRLEIADLPEKLGDYRVVREIGRGGMGVVYEARHDLLDRRVALKVLPKMFAQNKQFLERFIREAKAAGKLHHTNIVPLFDVGHQDGVHFYSMQYIHGQNLDVVIDELRRLAAKSDPADQAKTVRRASDESIAITLLHGELNNSSKSVEQKRQHEGESESDLELETAKSAGNQTSELSNVGASGDTYFRRVARVGIQVAEALDFANQQGWLHRDIKPSNLILDTDGVVWITDFGLAKTAGDELTHTGDIVGTLRYMAPERFQGDADARSDLYSLGLTLYELCTLKYAFNATDRTELINQVMNHSPVSLRRIRPEIPRDLETIIVKAMAREPGSRYETSGDLAADLRRFVAGKPVLARRISIPERVWRWSKRHPSRAALAVSLLFLGLTLILGSLYLAYNERQHSIQLGIENRKSKKAEEESRIAEGIAKEQAEKAQRATRASNGHRFWSHYRSGQALRTTGVTGQRDLALNELVSSWQVLPRLQLSDEARERRELAVRCQAIAALANWELVDLGTCERKEELSHALAIDLDSKTVVRSDNAGKLILTNFETGEEQGSLETSNSKCEALTFSVDGNYMLARHRATRSGRHNAVVWDFRTKQIVWQIEGVLANSSHAFSNDSHRLALSTESGLVIFDVRTGNQLKRLSMDNPSRALGNMWSTMAFAFDDQQLVFVSKPKNTIRFWSIEEDEQNFEIVLDTDINCLQWSETAQRLVVGENRIVSVFDGKHLDGDPLQIIAHTSQVVGVSLQPGGRLLATSGWDNATRIFDLEHEKQILQVFSVGVSAPGFSKDGEYLALLTLNRDVQYRRLEKSTVFESSRMAPIEKPQKLRFYPIDSSLVLYLDPQGLNVRNHQAGTNLAVVNDPTIYDFRISENGQRLFTCHQEGGVKVWPIELKKGSLKCGLPKLVTATNTTYLDWNDATERLLLRRPDSRFGLVSLNENSEVIRETTADKHASLNHARFSRDGKRIITTTWNGKGVRVWDGEGDLMEELQPDWRTTFFEFSPDSQRFVTSSAGEQWIWDAETLRQSKRIQQEKPAGRFGKVDWASNGKLIVSPYNAFRPQLVNATTGETLAVFEAGDNLRTGEFRFSADSRFLAILKTDQLHVWDLQKLQKRLKELGMSWKLSD